MNNAVLVRNAFVVMATAICLMSANPARAQPAPSANQLAQAKELVDIIGASREFESISTAIVVQTASNFLQANPALAKDLNEIAEQLVAEFLPRRQEIQTEVIKLYATRMTEPELKQVLDFYRSNVGKKLLSEVQNIRTEAAKKADALALKLREEVGIRVRAELKKRGHNI